MPDLADSSRWSAPAVTRSDCATAPELVVRCPPVAAESPSAYSKHRQPGAGTLPATLRNQSSSGAARTLLPLWRALVPGRGPVVGTHKRPFTARSRSSAGCAFR